MNNKQQGFTVIGLVLMVVMAVLIGMFLIKLIPPYMNNYAITKSVQQMDRLTGAEFSTNDEAQNIQAIRTRLMNQLSANGLYNMDEKSIEVIPSGKANVYKVTVRYQEIKPLFGSVSLLFVFNDVQEVTLAQGE
jgi:hypothetical protein